MPGIERTAGGSTRRRVAACLTALLSSLVTPCTAQPPGTEPALRALARCFDAEALPVEARVSALDRSLSDAERAAAAAPEDPVAHFALFCHHGRQIEAEGVSVRVLSKLRIARLALDRALALAPDYVDAVAAKGALLLRLPRLFGGDPDEGARLLRRAVALAPHDAAPRRLLAELVTGGTVADRPSGGIE